MFKWLNKQGVESDKGFVVQIISRFEVEYRQKAKKITVHMQIDNVSSSKMGITIHKSSFEHWDDGVHIPGSEQLKIINNFIDAMNFQDVDVIVED